MVYVKGNMTINFYEDSIKEQSEKEFIEGHGHHGMSEDELKEVHSLITKKNKKKVVKVPPSLN